MYLQEKNVLFLHPRKTTGTSIERALYPDTLDVNVKRHQHLFGRDGELGIWLQHATATTALDVIGEQQFRKAYRFATIRNPFTRILSVYYYQGKDHKKRFGSFQILFYLCLN